MTEVKETFSDIIKGEKPVLVDFYAEWCGPCKMMKPVLEELRKLMGDSIRILKIDIDKNPDLANKLQVRSVPTLILYKGGKQVWRQSGAMMAHQLKPVLKNYM